MKEYHARSAAIDVSPSFFGEWPTQPGFRLSEELDLFYTEGVTPTFVPADLGQDLATEVDADGRFLVDPMGDIRTSRMDLMDDALFAGLSNSAAAPAIVDPLHVEISDDHSEDPPAAE